MDHTSKKWRWVDNGGYLALETVEQDPEMVMAHFYNTGHNEVFMPDGEDADLIASAPELKELNREMLEALKECSYRLSCSARIDDLQASRILVKVDNVIDKAEEGK